MSKDRKDTMTVLEHLGELRKRVFISVVAFLIAAGFSFYHVAYIRYLLVNPAGDLALVYFSPPEAFMANIRLAIISGLVLSFPVFIYEILAFLFPGLHHHEKKLLLSIIVGGLLLFFSGAVFSYFIVLKLILHFFLNFQTGILTPMFNVSDYISFIITIILAFGLFFQLPLIMWVLGKFGLISSGFLKRNRKYALLIMLTASALITPPDIISQIMLLLPLGLLYETGIWAVLLTEKKREKDLLLDNGAPIKEDADNE